MSNIVAGGNVTATTFLGDGSQLTGIVTTLQGVSDNGNTTSNVVQFTNTTTGLVTTSNIVVGGNVTATTFLGDGGLLSNLVTTLQDVSDNGNTTSNTLQFTNAHTAFTTDLISNVGVNLGQLNNIEIAGASDSQIIAYDTASSTWVNDYLDHTVVRVKNTNGSLMSKGDVVHAIGSTGNDIFNVRLADASDPNRMPAIGILQNDLAINEQGTCVSFGRSDGVPADFIEGETVYVSNVNLGEISNVKPYGLTDLIQNVGIVVKAHQSQGVIFVTGVGRSNDIPNAPIVATTPNYVYANDSNNDMKKIVPSNLLTKLQTLQQVTDTGNTTSNTIQFTNATTGLVTTANLEVGSNISVVGLADATNKYLPMVDTDGTFIKSPVYVSSGGTYVISAAEAEFLGNITLSGNTTIIASNSVTIEDRIFGIGANNSTSGFDSGIIIEHQEGNPLEYANVALIHHADEHSFSIGYTQNTYTDDHILDFTDATHILRIRLRGNVEVQNNITVTETLDVTGSVTFANDLTVGAASNLFVDVSTSRVGINEATPTVSLDVGGDARVQSTTDTASTGAGALVVLGGLGVASNIHSTNVYVGSHVGVGTVSTTHPVHVMATTTGGVYVNGDGNDARLTLEPSETTKDPVISFNTSGENFSVGIDNSINDTFNIANHATDVGTNARLTVTPAGITTITNATNATSKTTGALILSGGGLGVAGDIYATNTNFEDVEADSVNVTDATTSDSTTTGALRVAGGVSTQENLNVGGVTKVWDSTAVTGKTDGALVVVGGVGISGDIHATHANLEDVEADSVNVTDTTAATTKTSGALTVAGGVGISGALFGSTADLDGTTEATSSTTGALKVAGGVGIAKDVYVGERAYVTGGLVTNTGGVTKKTYSFSGDLTNAQTIADSTIKITFSAHVFYAKIVAHLVESDDEVSTLSMECGGGHWTGGTPLAIAKGPLSIFGSASTNPWSGTITTTTTEVSFKPTTNMAADGHYNVFIEYISQSSSGTVTKITEGSTDVVTFGY